MISIPLQDAFSNRDQDAVAPAAQEQAPVDILAMALEMADLPMQGSSPSTSAISEETHSGPATEQQAISDDSFPLLIEDGPADSAEGGTPSTAKEHAHEEAATAQQPTSDYSVLRLLIEDSSVFSVRLYPV
jgi:Mg-chelatase subunit ChlD